MPDKITKFLLSLDQKTRDKLKSKLLLIRSREFEGLDIKKLQGWGNHTFRLRMGKIRIIFRFVSDQVEIIDIDYRGGIY